MINSSTEFNTLVLEGGHPYSVRISKSGGVIDCNIFKCSIYKGSVGSEVFSVGTVFIPYIELELDSVTEILENEEILLEVGLEINSSIEWISIGYFTVNKIPSSAVRTTITAVGRITSILPLVVPTLTTPTTIASVISDIQSAVRAEGYTDFTISHSTVDITGGEIENIPAGTTARELLELVTSLIGGYATEDSQGNVVIFKYDEANIINYNGDSMTTHPVVNQYDFDLENIKVVVQEAYESEDEGQVAEKSYVSGTPIDWGIVNQYMASQNMFDIFCSNCLGLTYRPSTIVLAIGDPRLEASDILRVTDINGNTYVVPCFALTHTIAGGTVSMIVAPDGGEQEATAVKGPLTKQLERVNAELLTAQDAVINRARIDAANITDLSAQNAWVNKILVQTGLLAHEGTIFTLDAIQVNAANITAGTIDVQRLIVTVDGEKYLVQFNTTGAPTYQKLDGNIVEDNTITAGKIVANSITTREITTENLVGTNGWINLSQGTFFYGNGGTWATSTAGIKWDGISLDIKGSVNVTGGNVYTKTEVDSAVDDAKNDAISTASADATSKATTAKSEAISEGRKYADNYLTVISGTTGISVHSQNDTSNYANINSNGMNVVKGGISIASFGDIARIGASTSQRIEIASSGMDFYATSTVNMAHIGYGITQSVSGNVIAPFYLFGSRKANTNVGMYSFAEGQDVDSSGYVSHAEGKDTVASGGYDHAEGKATIASGGSSHAEGEKTQATNFASHAEGEKTVASGYISHAEGLETTASGSESHSEGSYTEASGSNSHAEGNSTKATGLDSHAEGSNTEANGTASHSGGYYTIANGNFQTVIGCYNVADTTPLFIIGNGSSSARLNVFTVDRFGNVNIPTGADYKVNGTGLNASKVSKSGDTMTGKLNMTTDGSDIINITNGKANTDTLIQLTRTDTDVGIRLGIGSGGVNHGVWSTKLAKWMMYADASNVYLNGNAQTADKLNATKLTATYTSNSYVSETNFNLMEFYKVGNLVVAKINLNVTTSPGTTNRTIGKVTFPSTPLFGLYLTIAGQNNGSNLLFGLDTSGNITIYSVGTATGFYRASGVMVLS